MANATSLTLRDLVANGELADPAADTFDTGTSPVTVPLDVAGESDRVVLRVQNTAVANLTVTVAAGDDPPAIRAGLGGYASGNIAQNAVLWLGPFESARFIQNNGKLDVTLTPASGTIAANVRAFRLPRV
jgi:hypothetical protein